FGGDMAAMEKREGEIWGEAYQKEKKAEIGHQTPQVCVQIEVKQPEKVQPISPFTVVRAMKDGQPATNRDGSHKYQSKPSYTSNIPLYAAFPLQPTQECLAQLSKERELERLSDR